MSFSKMLEILKKKEEGKIVLVKLGTFYVAVGEDAVLLHKRIDLKCTCYKMNICKVGFPVIALDKYVEKLNETFNKNMGRILHIKNGCKKIFSKYR